MHFIFENCTECGIHFAKEKKLELYFNILSLSVYIDLIFLTMLTNITYSADVLGPFSKGGGAVWVDETLCIFRMVELHSAISVVFCNLCWFCF